jgi:hypothetical protein
LTPNAELIPRDYRILATLPANAFATDLTAIKNVQLTTMTALEILPVGSTDDRLNVLYARGVRARGWNRVSEAREAFALLLKEEPNSASVWYEMGKLSMGEGNCAEGATAFAHARAAMDSGADRSNVSRRQEDRRNLETSMIRILATCSR